MFLHMNHHLRKKKKKHKNEYLVLNILNKVNLRVDFLPHWDYYNKFVHASISTEYLLGHLDHYIIIEDTF